MKKSKTYFYKKKKRNYNLDLKKITEVFPGEAFDRYFENDQIAVPFAIYSELLEVLRTKRLYVTIRSENGKLEKQELSGTRIENFCRDFQKKMNQTFLV